MWYQMNAMAMIITLIHMIHVFKDTGVIHELMTMDPYLGKYN